MSRDNDNYEELLNMFDDEPQKKPASPAAPAAPADNDSEAPEEPDEEDILRVSAQRREKVKKFNLSIGSDSDEEEENPAAHKGVYFSNPPREISEEAERAKKSASNRSAARASAEAGQRSAQKPAKPEEKPKSGKAAPPPATEHQQKVIAVKQNKKAKKQADKVRGKTSTFSSFALSIAIILFFSVIISVYGINCVNDVLALKTDDTATEVTISANMSDSEVIKTLKKNDLIHNRMFCTLFLKVMNKGGDYVTGKYTLTPDMGLEKMISTMQADYTKAATVQLTFPEGWTVDQIAKKLESNKVCSAASFLTTIQNVDFSEEYDFLHGLENTEHRFRTLEGYIYPDTYDFYIGEPASSVVKRFLDNFKNKWIESYQTKADELGMSVDEIITFASILQKEAASADQMKTIASVLYNRLDSSNFMWLQCDSTETYLLETIKPTLTSSTEDTEKYIAYRDYYDTYSDECKGLPVGAICNPGDSAIYAALNPADTNYFYFRHDSAGKVYYASSFAEHEQNGRRIAENEE